MLRDDMFKLDLTSEYKIHELIFINSGSNYYARLPVDSHAALLSDNNSGKTSTLSALKLFLLPEINFKDCKAKFGFSSGGKYYSNIDSYQYYFPGTESYIICNASNPKHSFCWVLYRTTDFGYERIAVPKTYDDIEHLFWNASSASNEKAGQHQSDIGISDIKKKLIKNYGGVIFNDRKSIGEAIYTRTSAAEDHTRFSLLPMVKKFSDASVDTVRALLGMAFSLGDASTTTLPSAIGSIIDGMGMSVVKKNDDGIFLDIDNALDEWEQLKETDSKLKKVAAYQDRWQLLKTERKRYSELRKSLQSDFATTTLTVHEAIKHYGRQLEEVSSRTRAAEAEYNQFVSEYNAAKRTSEQTQSDLRAADKLIASLEKKLNKADFVRSRLRPLCPANDTTDDAILKAISDELKKCSEDIQSLKDQGQAIASMDRLNKSIKDKDDAIRDRKSALARLDSGHSFLDSLSGHAASVLISINNSFTQLDLSISDQQTGIIEAFAGLFSQDGQRISFCGSSLEGTEFQSYSKDESRIKIQKRIEELESELKGDRKQLSKLNQNAVLSPAERSRKLQEYEEDYSELQGEKTIIKGIDGYRDQYDESIENRKLLQALSEEQKTAYDEARDKRSELQLAYNKLKEREQTLTQPLGAAKGYMDELRRLAGESSQMLDVETVVSEQPASLLPAYQPEQTRSDIDGLRARMRETRSSRDDAIEALHLLLEHGIVDSTPEDRHAITTQKQAFEIHYAALQTVYENLDSSTENYKQRLKDHNNHAAITASMIEKVKGVVESFIDKINQELGGYSISNLDNVELVAELHPQYVNMARTLGLVANKTDSLLTEDFYKQISAFQSEFYIQRSGKVDIARIIQKVSYRFNRNGKKEEIPQSNGTNCMVNAVLLALLLKHMIPEDLSLAMPVIFDEVGSLDERNLREVLKVMEEHGLVLFAANPEPTGVIASVLSVYHDLSIFKATDAEIMGKAEAIYFPGMEERLENLSDDVVGAE
ncbi:coiled-coil domain-containing protein [Endozoicomonas euniceicola]|uniref:Uncharacterized protein n=1 Tax=Endozoicomonas euniceicola TaxID=1234143 RepID=A0ABY6GXX5_9GAMM|nr:hypothetical protein [Endozoicomonas euniceicola]UYM17635.1 hypothetical protein NX720_06935 [Endozoicomonas euniceicola]